ncbi:MAG: hypothetical protein RIR26_175 [Pseudomonadota bacterium]
MGRSAKRKPQPSGKKTKRVERTLDPHRHVLPMDEVPVDLGIQLEQRMDTRTNARQLGIDGGVGRGTESGSDLNSLNPRDTDENEYESITDTNLLTETAYINGVFQEHSVLREDDVTVRQHMHQSRKFSNMLETDQIEEIPARRREEVTFTPLSRKKGRQQENLKSDD